MMEVKDTQQCLSLGTLTRAQAKRADPAIEGIEWVREDQPLGCAKRRGFEQGIPIWKIRTQHWWHGGDGHPLRGEPGRGRLGRDIGIGAKSLAFGERLGIALT